MKLVTVNSQRGGRIVLGLLVLLWAANSWAQQAPADLTEIGLEKLMDMEITSVSKKEQKLFQAPSAIYVITAEDIRRSGATNIPDLLRLAPGVDVAQIDENAWAINIRGFNSRYADKVLVLIDGRTVYSPIFSGVNWDQQDVPLEDIERIEVIRGPGGTVWGANAVNGVISIITKTAKATVGGLISARAGSGYNGEGLVQYGGRMADKGAYRVFGKAFNVGNSLYHNGDPAFPNGGDANDGWYMAHWGARADWDLSPRDTFTLQGDFLKTNGGQTITRAVLTPPVTQEILNDEIGFTGGNILGRWSRTLGGGSDLSLQFYNGQGNYLTRGAQEHLNVSDLDFQHHLPVGSRNDVVWGLGYRLTRANLIAGPDVSFVPQRRNDQLFSGFVQDQIKITDWLALTLGSKFEHNAFTGFEYSPSAQLTWTPSTRHTVWFSAARAIRQPSIFEHGVRILAAAFPLPNGGIGALTVFGNPDTKAEQLRDFEAGYRTQLSNRLSLDLAAFTSYYRRLFTAEPGAPFFDAAAAVPHLVLPVIADNKAHAHDYGAEISVNWQATSHWRIGSGLDLIHMNVELDPSSRDTTTEGIEGDTPRHRFRFISTLKLPHNLEWDSSVFFIGRLPGGGVDRYTRLDTRLGWRLKESTELSVVGQNLLEPQHAEFIDAFNVIHTLVKRSIYAKITWNF